jgi:uncharacterized protein YbjT (DUF2867 family)
MTILITGAAGKLGSEVLNFLCQWNDPSTVIATSRNLANASKFGSKGVPFRVADFDKPETLLSAFKGVEKVMIISTDTFDTATRVRSQNQAIDAAVAANVGHVYYTSTACGGYSSKSDVYVQQGHLQTEEYLKKFILNTPSDDRSGLRYTIIREGIYAHEFVQFLNYKPESTEIVIPGDGPAAWATRSDLAEGTARIIDAPSSKYANQTILLTGAESVSLTEVVGMVVNETGKKLPVRRVSVEEYTQMMASAGLDDFSVQIFMSMFLGLQNGELSTVSPSLEELLRRKPKRMEQVVKETLSGINK